MLVPPIDSTEEHSLQHLPETAEAVQLTVTSEPASAENDRDIASAPQPQPPTISPSPRQRRRSEARGATSTRAGP
eukprot:m.9938 g.9938  ORF g.9938 m.9938 type:complete len:75 (-) comp9538_c0_seq2:63-287(-)